MGITWGSSKKADNHQGNRRSSEEVRRQADNLVKMGYIDIYICSLKQDLFSTSGTNCPKCLNHFLLWAWNFFLISCNETDTVGRETQGHAWRCRPQCEFRRDVLRTVKARCKIVLRYKGNYLTVKMQFYVMSIECPSFIF